MRTEMTSRSHPGRTQLPLHVLQVPRPSHHLLLIASNFYVLEMVRNWTMGEHGNNTTANHVSHFFIRPTDSSNRLSLLHPTHRFIKSSLTSSSDPQIHQIVSHFFIRPTDSSNRHTAIAQTQNMLSHN